MVYFGVFQEGQKDSLQSLEESVYNHWDDSSHAPPKRRPTEAIPDPVLQVLSWSGLQFEFNRQFGI